MPDFQITALPDIKLRLANMFTDSRVNKDNGTIMPESFKSIAENQKINAAPLMAAGTCQGFKLWWEKPNCDEPDCDGDLTDDLCDFDADETFELEEQMVEITNFCDDKFKIAADVCEDSNIIKFADKFSSQMATVFRNYEKKLNTKAIGFLNANIDDNDVVSGPMTNTPGVGTIIPSINWTANLMGNLNQVAVMNKMTDPILLNGNNFWLEIWNTQFAKCCTSEEMAMKFQSFRNWYWDIFNLDQTLGEQATFMWEAGSLAVLNEYHYMSPIPVEVTSDKHVYHVNHPTLRYLDGGTLKPVVIDVTRIRKCTTTSKGTLAADYYWHFRLRYEFLKSPVGCGGKLPLFKFINQ
jgi:hypothetical protein